ncbi:LysR family transcriptional regulator [Pandoraea fibrosis]|uniref:LysR family transcriptional regulator n=1 Tax=Pandoraea fibrosis TaxID=1891094 RepID=A0ABX6HPE8_9BURK|nr:LysR family transcriptional regulator [Pandoraea fibrosis]QHE93909.1 LysR family transcriptional regulator [Pandoraea fibrosis]QHF12528.1 LysR family transcriptional regulator [Pandoraea fibrosis]
MNRSLPLNALHVFDVAANELSFARAADRLFVTHGAVSRQIRTLEDALGLPLFERRNRAVFLTPAGERLHATTRQMFEQLASTVANLRPASPSRTLVVSCEPTLAMRWLIPRLGAFGQSHPDIALHLHSAGGPLDLASAGVDVAIRRNDFFWGHTLVAETLAEEWIGPVGLASAFDLPHPTQLHTRTRPGAWQDWQRAARQPAANASAPTTPPFEHFYLSLQAAGAGLGTAIGSVYMVSDELNAGRLVAPHGFVRDGSAYVALAREPFDTNPACAALLQWLRTALAESAATWISHDTR